MNVGEMNLVNAIINLEARVEFIEKEFLEKVNKANATVPGGVPQPPQAPPEAQRVDPSTHFVGSGDKMNFVTMNNARFQTNKKMADFVEVGYEMKNCNSSDGKTNSTCLWRRQSGAVDLDVTKGGDALVLLENITELKYKLLQKRNLNSRINQKMN